MLLPPIPVNLRFWSFLPTLCSMDVLIHDFSNKGATRLALHPLWMEAENVAVLVKVSYEGSSFIVSFSVKEPQLRRMCTHHNDEVWNDSCVEVFVKRPDQPWYVNFEFSASGFCHAAKGTCRDGRVSYSDALLATIPITVRILENTIDESRWDLSARLDLAKFGLLDEGKTLKGVTLYGNFYNCGDALEHPHYLTYEPIDTERPDFHQVSSFVPLRFL